MLETTRIVVHDGLAARLARERALLAVSRPRLVRVARWLGTRPWTVLPLAFFALGMIGASNPAADAEMFLTAGRTALGPRALDVFADPALQMGPISIVLAGAVARVADAAGISALFLLGAVQGVLVLLLAQTVAGRAAARSGIAPARAGWVITVVLLAGGSLAEATLMGHTEEITLGLVLAWAALDCAAGRRWSVGVLLGLATGVKLWAVLGLPLVLVGRRWRAAAARAAIAAVVVLCLYGPFLAWGDVRTFQFAWTVTLPSTVALVVGAGVPAGWALRMAQAAAVVAGGALLAWRPRVDPLAVVAAILAVRLLLDPIRFPYYPGPLLAVVVFWTWTSTAGAVRRWRIPALAAAPMVTLAPYVLADVAEAVVGTVVLGTVLTLVLGSLPRGTDPAVAARPVGTAARGESTSPPV